LVHGGLYEGVLTQAEEGAPIVLTTCVDTKQKLSFLTVTLGHHKTFTLLKNKFQQWPNGPKKALYNKLEQANIVLIKKISAGGCRTNVCW
jgi:hypothetical protein